MPLLDTGTYLGWSSFNEGVYASGQRVLAYGGHFNNVVGKIPVIHCHDYWTGSAARFPVDTQHRAGGFTTGFFAIAGGTLHPVLSGTLGGGATFGIDAVVVTGGQIDQLIGWSGQVPVNAPPPFDTREDKVCVIGDGTGALDALNWAWRHQDKVLCIILRSPAVALDAYHDRNAGGQAAAMETAYGGLAAFNAALPTHDPMLNLGKISMFGDRIQCWVGSNDSLIPEEEVENFAALVGAEVHVLDGLTHSDAITGGRPDMQAAFLMRTVEQRRLFIENWNIGDWSNWDFKICTNDPAAPESEFVHDVMSNPWRGRVYHANGVANNFRQYAFPKNFYATDTEVFSLWASGEPTFEGQQGHMHRYTENDPIPGSFIGHMFWHDIAFSVPWIMNIATFTSPLDGNGPFVGLSPGGGGAIPGLRLAYGGQILASSRTSNIHDFIVDPTWDGRIPEVGDTISTEGLTGLPNTAYFVTAVNLPHLTLTSPFSTGPDVVSGGTGTYGNITRAFPYYVKSQVYGNPPNLTLRVKAWPPYEDEPEWGDSNWGFVINATTSAGSNQYGRSGLFIAHPRELIWGPVEVREL